MRKACVLVGALLIAYSAAMASVEWTGGHAAARLYLDDPPAIVPLAHLHTAISAAWLAACAVAFLAARRAAGAAGALAAPEAFFLDSQVVLFGLLALDEPLRFAPLLARWLGVPDAVPYVAAGAVETGLLLGPGALLRATPSARRAAIAASVLFAAAVVLDDAPARIPLRGCAEDLPKLWGGALFFVFAWSRLEQALDALAFPGIHGSVFRWGRTAAGYAARPAGERPETVRRSAGSTAPMAAVARGVSRSVAEVPADAAEADRRRAPERSGAPARRADAPEPGPSSPVSDASAAPPRKLLSH